MTVTCQASFDTVAGIISFENEALFLKDEEGYKLVWDDFLIFPNLTSADKVGKIYAFYMCPLYLYYTTSVTKSYVNRVGRYNSDYNESVGGIVEFRYL